MTVKELIEALSKHDPDLQVCKEGREGEEVVEDLWIYDTPWGKGKIYIL